MNKFYKTNVFCFKLYLFLFIKTELCPCVLSPAEPHRPVRRLQGPSPGPGPSAAAEDHGPGCKPTGAAHTHVSRVSKRLIDRCLIISTSELCVFSSCGSEWWAASSTRTTGPEKDSASVSSPRSTCEWTARVFELWNQSSARVSSEVVVVFCVSGLDLRVWRSVRSFLTSVTSSETPRVRYSLMIGLWTPPAGHIRELHLTPQTRFFFCDITKASPAARLAIPHSRHTFQSWGLLVPPLSLSSRDRLQRSVITGTTLPVEDRKPGPWTALPEAKHLSSSASQTIIMSAGSIFMSVCQLEANLTT